MAASSLISTKKPADGYSLGLRAAVFEIEGLGSDKRKYLKWLMTQSAEPKTKIKTIITDEALIALSDKLTTPLQFEQYLTLIFEEAYKVGQKPVEPNVIETVLAKDIDALEPRLTHHGYNAKALAEVLNVNLREIKSLLHIPPELLRPAPTPASRSDCCHDGRTSSAAICKRLFHRTDRRI